MSIVTVKNDCVGFRNDDRIFTIPTEKNHMSNISIIYNQ